MKDKEILVWNGFLKGYEYITKEEMEKRKLIQKKMMNGIIKIGLWFLVIFFILIAIVYNL